MIVALRRWRTSAAAAYIAPLAAFSLLTALPGLLRLQGPGLPWYQQAPEHWVWPLQSVLCGVVLAFFWRRHYVFAPFRGFGLAVLLGAVGIACWIAPTWAYLSFSVDQPLGAGWWSWLGATERLDGFNPAVLDAYPLGRTGSLLMRFVRLVIVVPLVEELFWRGFLMRYVVAESRGVDWPNIPFGTHQPLSFFIVTVSVMGVHQMDDWAAALVWGTLMYWLAVRSKSLGACVLMHAVGNLILGLYVLRTGQWGLW
jgi:CAAX prenyl protease-like protein